MLNEKRKAKNSNKAEPNEAVKLSCGLVCFSHSLHLARLFFCYHYILEIIDNTITIITDKIRIIEIGFAKLSV